MHFSGSREEADLSGDKSWERDRQGEDSHAIPLSQRNSFAGSKLDIMSTPILLENLLGKLDLLPCRDDHWLPDEEDDRCLPIAILMCPGLSSLYPLRRDSRNLCRHRSVH